MSEPDPYRFSFYDPAEVAAWEDEKRPDPADIVEGRPYVRYCDTCETDAHSNRTCPHRTDSP